MFLFRALVFAGLGCLYAGGLCVCSAADRPPADNRSRPNEVHTASTSYTPSSPSSSAQGRRTARLFQLDEEQLKQGIDPLEYIKMRRKHRRRHRRRKTHNRDDLLTASSSDSKHAKASPPRAEFLLPEQAPAPDKNCKGGSSLSGISFINFLFSAIAVGANVVNNANNNQRNNNNNNNDNNDNMVNFNIGNNNNAGNNMNTLAICPFPCIPGIPPIPTFGRRRRSAMSDEEARADKRREHDLIVAALLLMRRHLGPCGGEGEDEADLVAAGRRHQLGAEAMSMLVFPWEDTPAQRQSRAISGLCQPGSKKAITISYDPHVSAK